MNNQSKFIILLILFLTSILILINIVKADDNIYIKSNNQVISNQSKLILENNIISDILIDTSNIYLFTEKNFYIINKSTFEINYKLYISGLNEQKLTDNFVYLKSNYLIYKVNKSSGLIEEKQYYNSFLNNIYSLLGIQSITNVSSNGTIINNYYTNTSNTTNNYYNASNSILTPLDLYFHINNSMEYYLNTSTPLQTIINYSIENGNTFINYWISPQINITYIPSGSASAHIQTKKEGGINSIDKIYYLLYLTNETGENKTLLSQSSYSIPLISGSIISEDIISPITSEIQTNLTDRILIEFYINQTGFGGLPDVYFYYDYLTASRLIMPLHQLLYINENQVTNLIQDLENKWNKTDNINQSVDKLLSNYTNNLNWINNSTMDKDLKNYTNSLSWVNNSTIQINESQVNNLTTDLNSKINSSGYYRQFWQKQGIAVINSWSWGNSVGQTDYASITDEGAGYFLSSSSQNLSEYKWITYLPKGKYKLVWVHIKENNRGYEEILLNETQLIIVDCYSIGSVKNVVEEILFDVNISNSYEIRIRSNGKNPSSSGYYVEFSRIQLEKIGEI